jgi:tetratricopeptide (TPR) repeat protein
MAETNPVQQRMEYLVDSWNDIPKKKYKIIRTIIEPGDEKMIEAFYNYLTGINVPVAEIIINLNVAFDDIETFSKNLVNETESMVSLWNEADFSATKIDKATINWTPDYTISDKRNESHLFVDNFNKLTKALDLDKGRFLVVNLATPYVLNKKGIQNWLTKYLSLDIHPQLKLLITDTSGNEIFRNLNLLHGEHIYNWEPKIDTPSVIEKVAAMGDPEDPGTVYRLYFAKMMTAMSTNKHKEMEKEAFNCLTIACENVDKDPYWIAQVVTINIILSNEYYRKKQLEKALSTADQAIKIGETVPQVIGETAGCGVLAQAQLNKATILSAEKKWKDCIDLYELAADNLIKSNIHISALDCYRMAAYCAVKISDKNRALDNLDKGYKASMNIDNKTLKYSTFSLLIHQLLKLDYQKRIPEKDLKTRLVQLYGENWEDMIKKTWEHIDFENIEETQIAVSQNNKNII